MSLSILKGKQVDVHLWTRLDQVESGALDQLRNIAALPWAFHHVAVMPDVHFGKGATVGSVVAMKDAVAPAAVGVDIGCGMGAVPTTLKASHLPDSLRAVRTAVEHAIPVGFSQHDRPVTRAGTQLGQEAKALMDEFSNLTPQVKDLFGKASRQLGTLGGGNHFIELCVAQDDSVWLLLHSGSRNIGKSLAEVHISRARKLAHNQKLPDRDLAVFLAGTDEMAAYRRDLFWAQRYAMLNRKVMMWLYADALRTVIPGMGVDPSREVWCHHNYVAEETHFGEQLLVTRKGAIRAGKGELGIIPGSMGTRSYIVRGRGCAESYESASHGAGRAMSRGQAKRQFTVKDLEKQTEGVECRKDRGVLDEIPGAYKDIDTVMANQSELVEVVVELRQVMCVKG